MKETLKIVLDDFREFFTKLPREVRVALYIAVSAVLAQFQLDLANIESTNAYVAIGLTMINNLILVALRRIPMVNGEDPSKK